jgi:hypothetical protein
VQSTELPSLQLNSILYVPSQFAKRLLTSITNSVLSKRSFSNINYIYSKLRNKLDVKHADMLQFIHMNSDHGRQQQDADIEDRLLEIEEEYN